MTVAEVAGSTFVFFGEAVGLIGMARRQAAQFVPARRGYVIARAVYGDLITRFRYGENSPRAHELIWVRTEQVLRSTARFRVYDSGRVKGGDWDLDTNDVMEIPKIAACRLRWHEGKSWEETGILRHCNPGNRSLERYMLLDRLYKEAEATGRIKPKSAVGDAIFREFDSIMINVGRSGEPIFACSGYHRMAIAKLANVTWLPAQIGVVHENALNVWRKRFSR